MNTIYIVGILLLAIYIFFKLKKKLKPFTHNPEDFKVRLTPSFFSNDYALLEYSGNGGESWKTLPEARSPLFDHSMDYNWTWGSRTWGWERINKKQLLLEFSSLQKIEDYIKKQEKIYAEGREKRNKQIEDYYNRRNEIYK